MTLCCISSGEPAHSCVILKKRQVWCEPRSSQSRLNSGVFQADVLTKFTILTTLFKHVNNFARSTLVQKAKGEPVHEAMNNCNVWWHCFNIGLKPRLSTTHRGSAIWCASNKLSPIQFIFLEEIYPKHWKYLFLLL